MTFQFLPQILPHLDLSGRCFVLFHGPGFELKVSYLLGEHSVSELCLQSFSVGFVFYFEAVLLN